VPGESQAQRRASNAGNNSGSASYETTDFRPSGSKIAKSAIIAVLMPSPIGHALAGVAVAWSADLVDGRRSSPRLVAACGALAMLPDADLLIPGTHRMATHSLAAAVSVFIIAASVTAKVTSVSDGVRHRGKSATVSDTVRHLRSPVILSLAYASHLLLDWLGADFFPPRGIQLLWPFSDRWMISGWDIFRQTARRQFLTAPIIRQNALAVAQELAILLPIVLVLWLIRVKAAPRLSTELAGRHHTPQ
jgi:membrane-bound metal-dependent hydrolase YbcI (DUF457 family)